MADDVNIQADVTVTGEISPRTLHLKMLRKQWQIISLQVIATIALIGMYLEVVSTYVVGSIDHTMLFDTIEILIGDQLPIGDWLTGEVEMECLDSTCPSFSAFYWVEVWLCWHSKPQSCNNV